MRRINKAVNIAVNILQKTTCFAAKNLFFRMFRRSWILFLKKNFGFNIFISPVFGSNMISPKAVSIWPSIIPLSTFFNPILFESVVEKIFKHIHEKNQKIFDKIPIFPKEQLSPMQVKAEKQSQIDFGFPLIVINEFPRVLFESVKVPLNFSSRIFREKAPPILLKLENMLSTPSDLNTSFLSEKIDFIGQAQVAIP